MPTTSASILRSPVVARGLARSASAAAALAATASLYTVLFGGFRIQLGAVRFSAGSWYAPLTQALWSAVIAAAFYYRDARARGTWDRIPQAVQRFFTGTPVRVRLRVLWTALGIGTFVSLLVSWRIAHGAIVLGSSEGRWVFDVVQPFNLSMLATFAWVAALALTLLFVTSRARGSEWLPVMAWVLVAIGLQAGLRSLAPSSGEQIVLSLGANSYYAVTQDYSASSALTDFARLRDLWPMHAHSNMPGKLMLFYALELVSSRPAVLGWLIVALSNLGGILMYVFVRDLFGDRRIALYSLVLYLFVPGKIFFFPLLNTVTPVLALGLAVLAMRWSATGRAAYAAAIGIVLYAIVFFEPLPLVILMLVAALAARALWHRDVTWSRLAMHSAVAAAGFTATYAAMRMAFGFDLFDALRRVSADAVAFNSSNGRLYGAWVSQNLTDFFFGAGVCQTILFPVALADGLRDRSRRALAHPAVLLTLTLAAMLLVIDLSGVNRGEVTRLWIFLQCFLQIPTAYLCARLSHRGAITLVVAATILQAALGTAIIGFVVT